MERRIALKNLALILGGAALLPSCLGNNTKNSIKLNHFSVDPDLLNLVNLITDTIIPKTKTLGAVDLNLKDFVFLMLDDCYPADDHRKFFKGAQQFNDAVEKQHGKAFDDCNRTERENFLISIEQASEQQPEELQYFYRFVKENTVFGYRESKYFLTEIKPYKLIPGPYTAYYAVRKLDHVEFN